MLAKQVLLPTELSPQPHMCQFVKEVGPVDCNVGKWRLRAVNTVIIVEGESQSPFYLGLRIWT